MFEFSQLEHALKHYVALRAGVKEEYFDAVMTHDFSLLFTMVLEVFGSGMKMGKRKELEGIIRKCRDLNNARVRVAHGLWMPFRSGGTVHHVARTSLRSSPMYDQAVELQKEAEKANALRARFEELVVRTP
jgi:hypothetical protein